MIQLPTFRNKSLFEQAFTHRSYLNETREAMESNERLEFLGDCILSYVISEYLYTNYPQYDEGILTNLRSLLVNTRSLAAIAKRLDFGTLLKLSKGEEESEGRENETLLANCFEAYIGALYLDQGIEAIKEVLRQLLIPKIRPLVEKKVFKDPKSMLQERVQAHRFHSPTYRVLREEGPPHAKLFTIGVFVKNTKVGEGDGKSKQEAEEQAAIHALDTIDLHLGQLDAKKE